MDLPTSETWLACLRCPITGSTLRSADHSLVERINQAIAAGTIANRIGESIREPIEGGLVNEGGDCFYPVKRSIPTLIADDSIPLEQL